MEHGEKQILLEFLSTLQLLQLLTRCVSRLILHCLKVQSCANNSQIATLESYLQVQFVLKNFANNLRRSKTLKISLNFSCSASCLEHFNFHAIKKHLHFDALLGAQCEVYYPGISDIWH